MRSKFMRELLDTNLPRDSGPDRLVAEQDLVALPESAKRYFRFMGVVGLPLKASRRGNSTLVEKLFSILFGGLGLGRGF